MGPLCASQDSLHRPAHQRAVSPLCLTCYYFCFNNNPELHAAILGAMSLACNPGSRSKGLLIYEPILQPPSARGTRTQNSHSLTSGSPRPNPLMICSTDLGINLQESDMPGRDRHCITRRSAVCSGPGGPSCGSPRTALITAQLLPQSRRRACPGGLLVERAARQLGLPSVTSSAAPKGEVSSWTTLIY